MSAVLAHHPAAPPAARVRIAEVGRWAAGERRLLPSSALAVVVLVECALPRGRWTAERVGALLGGAGAWCRQRGYAVPAGAEAAVWSLIEHDHRLGRCSAQEREALQALALADGAASARPPAQVPVPVVRSGVRRLRLVPAG